MKHELKSILKKIRNGVYSLNELDEIEEIYSLKRRTIINAKKYQNDMKRPASPRYHNCDSRIVSISGNLPIEEIEEVALTMRPYEESEFEYDYRF